MFFISFFEVVGPTFLILDYKSGHDFQDLLQDIQPWPQLARVLVCSAMLYWPGK